MSLYYKNYYLVGVGGTGCFLAEPLARLLKFHSPSSNLFLIDGDSFETSNQERQLYNYSVNKAISKEYELREKDIEVKSIPEYLTPKNVNLIEDNSCVILSVDRDTTRKLTLEYYRDKLHDWLWISPGNDYDFGNINIVKCVNNVEKNSDPLAKFNNLNSPKDTHPLEDCMEESQHYPQLITANMGAAWLTLTIIQNIIEDNQYLPPSEIWYKVNRDLTLHTVA